MILKTSLMAYLKEIKVTYNRKRVKDDLLKKAVKNPKQVYELFKEMENELRMKVVCLHLNPQLEILSYEVVSIGTSHRALIDVAGIYRGVLLSGASRIILIYNHPNGPCMPSAEEKKSAKKIAQGGEPYDITLEDFILIGEDGYYSFNEKKKFGRKEA